MAAPIVVVFRSRLLKGAEPLHEELMGPVAEAAAQHQGIESYKSFEASDGERVTIVELRSDAALEAWATDPVHRSAKARAGEIYEWFRTDITRRVEGLIAEG